MVQEHKGDDGSLNHAMARGTAWMVAMRWTIRSIGFVNTILLARLLTPEDFGIVAMATVVVGLLSFVAEFGVDIAVIRNRSADRSYLDSAWTLQVISGIAKALVVLLLAPVLASYFGEPRVATVLYIVALAPAIIGFENIGQVEFRRGLEFNKEFRYWVYRRLISFALTICLALWLRNYLVLAIAQPIFAIVTVALSFLMSAYRPRFATKHIGEIWTFSKWWILLAIARFFGNRGEEFVLGNATTPEVVGAYYVGGDVARLVTAEVVLPSSRAIIPGFARISHDRAQLHEAFELSFAFLATVCLAAGVGASLVADQLVPVLLGANWVEAIPFFRWLAIHGAAWSIVQAMQPYFVVSNTERLFTLCSLGYAAVLVPVVFATAYSASVEVVAMARTATSILFLAGMLCVLLALRVFTPKRLIQILYRPVLATAAMAGSVLLIEVQALQIIQLACKVLVGAAVFFAVTVGLWLISGRPRGIEASTLRLLRNSASQYRGTR